MVHSIFNAPLHDDVISAHIRDDHIKMPHAPINIFFTIRTVSSIFQVITFKVEILYKFIRETFEMEWIPYPRFLQLLKVAIL